MMSLLCIASRPYGLVGVDYTWMAYSTTPPAPNGKFSVTYIFTIFTQYGPSIYSFYKCLLSVGEGHRS